MARFIAFVDDDDDIHEYRRDHPDHDFSFVSFRRLKAGCVVIGPAGFSATLRGLQAEHARSPFLGIVFGSMAELYVAVAARAAEALGLRRFVADATAARDKHAMRSRLAGFTPGPRSRLLRNAADAAKPTGISFPCVLKPRHGYGSICVVTIRDRAELVRTHARMSAVLEAMSRANPLAIPSADMLVEEFVGGSEHTVDMFLTDSRPVLEIVSDKFPMPPPTSSRPAT